MRILLFALSVGVIFLMGINDLIFALSDRGILLTWLFIGVAASAVLFAVFSIWVRHGWVIILQLAFDMCWIGGVVYITGGILGPGAPLIFAVVILGTILLPGVLPFFLATVGALILIANALLYVAAWVPFEDISSVNDRIGSSNELILSTITVQVLAIFLIEVLGQTLARRTREQKLVVGDLLDQVGDGILLIDKKGLIRHINEQATRLLKLPAHIEGQALDAHVQGAEFKILRRLLFDTQGLRAEHMQTGRDYLLAMANDVHGRGGRLYGRMLSIRDETSLRKLEENVRRSEHLASLGEMAAGIAHEIRNPLTSLRGCAQELHSLSSEAQDETGMSLSQIIVKESDRLSHIVEDVLGFARQHSLYLQPLALEAFLKEIQKEYQERLQLPDAVGLEIEIREPLPEVYTDAEKLRQILHNLIDNAVQAVGQSNHPLIRISLELSTRHVLENVDQTVVLRVQDNGIGIAADKVEQVFTPFYSTHARGTGLGLALVQRLIRALGGALELDSEEGVGTTVSIILPVDQTQRQFDAD